MRIAVACLALLLIAGAPNPKTKIAASPPGGAAADVSLSRWGVLEEIAKREWTTEKEPRPRVSKFRWIEPGRVLEARHGFVSRLQFGEAKFADTVQRFVLDPKSGTINVTYNYEDGRPPLKSVIRIEPDGSAVETFTDAKGVKKRNIYKSPSLSLNFIERQEMKGSTWASLGITRKAGLTQAEIAENRRRAEEERQLAIARENARRAAERAQREAELAAQQAAYEQQQAEQQAMQQNMPNMLDVLNGIGAAIQQQNYQQQQAFERQMRSQSYSGGSGGGGAIIVENPPPPAYTPAPPPRVVQPAPPPPVASSPPAADTCKRRETRMIMDPWVGRKVPTSVCLDARQVTPQ